jgi:hypothetical protein
MLFLPDIACALAALLCDYDTRFACPRKGAGILDLRASAQAAGDVLPNSFAAGTIAANSPAIYSQATFG